ncbi:hypothetical protein [Brevundimonas bacteroides]|uniref:hypothetical protein n=1 Tax=Brevundimonas bacteroides TaxID=74311 RepID=UPI00068A2063|nr:hypothetical protein [Brevundimonas bacteroides]
MLYEFRFFIGRCDVPAVEQTALDGDRAAIARAASELLRMPSRRAVEVWAGPRLVYHRARFGRAPWEDPKPPA